MGLYRKVIRIRGEDSPNVRLALAQIQAGKEPTGEMIVPGVLPWHDYVNRRQNWDKIKQTIGIDAEFYEGSEILLYPTQWLDRAEALYGLHRGRVHEDVAIGVDPAEGGDKTVFSVVDRRGLIEQESARTIDTAVIIPSTVRLMRKYNVRPERVYFDRGGGGKQHVDQLRAKGFPVRTVAFGEPVMPEPAHEVHTVKKRKARQEERYPCKNRRADMYWRLRMLLTPPWLLQDPDDHETRSVHAIESTQFRLNLEGRGFALPPQYTELRRQLSLMPLKYDADGRMYLPPKTRKTRTNLSEKTLEEIIGHSPDEADSLVVAVYAMTQHVKRARISPAW